MDGTQAGFFPSNLDALLGVILGFIFVLGWDKYKENTHFVRLMTLVLQELENNMKRAQDAFNGLPEYMKEAINEGSVDVQLEDEELLKVAWSFPKPYITQAWQTFIQSGFTAKLHQTLAHDLFKLYDDINSINFLGARSFEFFQVLSSPNKLDADTNKSFDRFCRIGTKSVEAMLVKDFPKCIGHLKAMIASFEEV